MDRLVNNQPLHIALGRLWYTKLACSVSDWLTDHLLGGVLGTFTPRSSYRGMQHGASKTIWQIVL